jgi:cytochrome P450
MRSTFPAAPSRMGSVIPCARRWPVLGSLPALAKDPFGFLTAAAVTFGDMYLLDLGVAELVVLTHPRHAQHVLVDHAANYSKGGALWQAMRKVFGNGLLVSEGEFWLRQRRMMNPHFHRRRLAELATLMVGAIDEVLEGWSEAGIEQSFDLVPTLTQLTTKVTTRTLFGTSLAPDGVAELSQALVYVVDYMIRAMIFDALPSWLPLPGRRRHEQAIAAIDRSVYRIIASGRQSRHRETNLLGLLLDAVDEESGEKMTDQQLRDEVTALFLAGYETTALALAWALEMLTRRPDMMQKLQAEVDGALGSRQPTFADLPQLPYARMVLQETMRLRPPIWQVPRVAEGDDEIDGRRICAGTTVILLIYACHRHPGQWPDPERFDPERFVPERAEGRHKLAYMPFGAGQHLCIGREFALMEGQLALAMLAQRYRISSAASRPAEPYLSTTLHPKGRLPMRLRKR